MHITCSASMQPPDMMKGAGLLAAGGTCIKVKRTRRKNKRCRIIRGGGGGSWAPFRGEDIRKKKR